MLSPGVRGCRCLLVDVRGVATLCPSNDTKGAEAVPVVLGGVPHLVIYVTYWGRAGTAHRTYAQFQVGQTKHDPFTDEGGRGVYSPLFHTC